MASQHFLVTILKNDSAVAKHHVGRKVPPIHVWPSYAIDVMIDDDEVGLESHEWEGPELRQFIGQMIAEGKI